MAVLNSNRHLSLGEATKLVTTLTVLAPVVNGKTQEAITDLTECVSIMKAYCAARVDSPDFWQRVNENIKTLVDEISKIDLVTEPTDDAGTETSDELKQLLDQVAVRRERNPRSKVYKVYLEQPEGADGIDLATKVIDTETQKKFLLNAIKKIMCSVLPSPQETFKLSNGGTYTIAKVTTMSRFSREGIPVSKSEEDKFTESWTFAIDEYNCFYSKEIQKQVRDKVMQSVKFRIEETDIDGYLQLTLNEKVYIKYAPADMVDYMDDTIEDGFDLENMGDFVAEGI